MPSPNGTRADVQVAVYDRGHGWTQHLMLVLGQQKGSLLVAESGESEARVRVPVGGRWFAVYNADDSRTTRFHALQGFEGADVCVLVIGEITQGALRRMLEDLEAACAQDSSLCRQLVVLLSLNAPANVKSFLESFPFPEWISAKVQKVDLKRPASWWEAIVAHHHDPPALPDGAMDVPMLIDDTGGSPATLDSSTRLPPVPNPSPLTEIQMANINDTLTEMMKCDGAMAAVLVDSSSGMTLGRTGGGVNLDVAAAGNTEVVRAKLKTMKALGLNDTIEDILITLGNQYHIIRLLKAKPSLFFYVVLEKAKANLAMARFKIAEADAAVQV